MDDQTMEERLADRFLMDLLKHDFSGVLTALIADLVDTATATILTYQEEEEDATYVDFITPTPYEESVDGRFMDRLNSLE